MSTNIKTLDEDTPCMLIFPEKGHCSMCDEYFEYQDQETSKQIREEAIQPVETAKSEFQI